LKYRFDLRAFLICFLALLFVSCKADMKNSKKGEQNENISDSIIDVVTEGMEFQMMDSIPSGWNTFRYHNRSQEPHFFIFEKLPEGIRIDNYKNELVPPFIRATELLLEGNSEEGYKEFENIPNWFWDVKVSGGVSLISPNTTGESTVFLEPGIYAMECYVRMPNGMAHAFFGMLKEVVVTDSKSTLHEPSADYDISIASTEGITFNDSVISGKRSFRVKFKDQVQYETLLGHDVNLVKVEDFELIDTLNIWINAADLKAFRSPSPEGITFLGGVNDSQSGRTGYFSAELTPGNYVLISEVPDANSKGMLKTFTVE
jgi:hypothetical protein